jgi:transcriptional regulator with XRE-family HTH domain
MLTKDTIDQFYTEVEKLGLRHPVAEIARKTGESKGNVSEYLRRLKEPSENFINEFYRSFKIVPRGTAPDEIKADPPPILSADFLAGQLKSKEEVLAERDLRRQDAELKAMEFKQQNDRLLQHNEKLLDIIKENLNIIITNSSKSLEHLVKVERILRSDDGALMDAHDRHAGLPVGTTSKEASIVEHAHEQEGREIDKQSEKDK